MNRRGRTGLENPLLRWVQRHRSMTALFRAPGADRSRRLNQPNQAPVVQTRLEDFPLSERTPAEGRIIEPTSPPPSIVARKVDSPSAPVTVLQQPKRTPASPPTKAARGSDSDWQRLETIFRKHQEQSESKAESTPGTTPPAIEPEGSNPAQTLSQKEPINLPAETTALPQNAPRKNIPQATPPAAKLVQRQVEKTPNPSQSAATNVMRKEQLQDSASVPHAEPITKADFHETPTRTNVEEEMHEVIDEEPFNDSPPQQAVPLEYVWNVQRMEAPETAVDTTSTPATSKMVTDEPVFRSPEIAKPREQQLESKPQVFQKEPQTEIGDLENEQRKDPNPLPEAEGPIEILAPSRPRPQAKVLPTQELVQTQPQNSQDEIPASHLVDTAIGPLPSDLWQLIGQEPPASAPNPTAEAQVQRSPDSAPKSASTSPGPRQEEKPPTTTAPTVIQRQMLTNDDLMPPTLAEQGDATQEDEKNSEELDIDDLARRVFAEIRRRLAAEWERIR